MTGLETPRDRALEEKRLENAEEVMYGNKDTKQLFPFDIRMRYKYVVYHESLQVTEDGQVLPKLTTRRFSFFSPAQWTLLMKKSASGKNWFEQQKKAYTILHDPIEQARMEGKTIQGYTEAKTGLSLADKLKNAKKANEVAGLKEEDIIDASKKRAASRRKEVKNAD